MDRKPDVAADRVYEDFDPTSQWAAEPAFDTLAVYLTGFKKEQLKVQVTSSGKLRIIGERPIAGGNKWSRFHREFPIPSNYNAKEITARFEGGTLYIKHPKIITSAHELPQPQVKPPIEKTPKTNQNPTTDHQSQTQKINDDIQKQAASHDQAPQLRDDHQKSSTSPTKPPVKPTSEPKRKQNNGDQEQANTRQEVLPPKEKSSTTNDGKDGDVSTKTGEKKQENLGDSSVQDAAKTGIAKGKLLTMELKNPRKLLSLVVAVLLVLVLGLYARNAIRSIGKSEN